MRYFLTVLFTQLRCMLRTRSFMATSFFFVVLTVTFGAVLPRSQPSPMKIGLVTRGTLGAQAAAELMQNSNYRFVPFQDPGALEQAIIVGEVHCGYLLEEADKPITLLVTDNAYMHPLVNEVVLSAWLMSQSPTLVGDFLTLHSLPGDAPALLEQARQNTRPMTVELVQAGGAGLLPPIGQTAAQPLLYAVMISAYLATSLLAVLLTRPAQAAALGHLAVFTGHSLTTRMADALAQVLLNLAVLLAADGLLSLLLGTDAYPLAARLPMLGTLAVFSLLFVLGGGWLRRWAAVVTILLPPALLVGVLCSGALVNPLLLPGSLGLLRFLSPAWYLLRFLQ